MDIIEKLWYVSDKGIPVRLVFTDGVVTDGVMIEHATPNDFEIVPTKEYLKICKMMDSHSCVGEYEDVSDVILPENVQEELEGEKNDD